MNSFSLKLPPVKSAARIGLLGGSFDPPHLCHALLGVSFLALEPIDELWVIPCVDHAFKGKLSDFHHRFAMCEIAFRRIENVRILDIEKQLVSPSYTIETINAINNARPDLKLTLGLGSDLVANFDKWHNAHDLTKKVDIVIFERMSYPISHVPSILTSAKIHHGYPLPDTNSTNLREALRTRALGHQQLFLDKDVLDYIKEHHLYAVVAGS